MDHRISDCLENKQGSYILPFFWQHGEDRERLLEEIEAMAASNVRAFCVESRIHEDFGGDAWWADMAFILEEAKKRDMQVWLLDDKKFPTGYANGILEKGGHPGLRKRGVRETHADFLGPLAGAAVPSYGRYNPDTETLIGVYAYKRTGEGEASQGDPVDLTPFLRDELLYWDIPDGVWRVFWVIDTDASPDCYRDYIDMLNPDSCKLMLETVYEPHYRHFASYFGSTFQGFFSDEPCFANDSGTYYSRLGKPGMVLPWRHTLLPLLAAALDIEEAAVQGLLPALWYDCGSLTARLRVAYMDAVTRQYSENFCWMLGDWCRAHGVQYIGHVIEDMNTHMRTGHGPGHFFRALDGQDMAGIDIVLNQLVPGLTDTIHTAPIMHGVADPAFFNYTLAKLAASHSHLQPLKKGRAMCEIFGAFGWAEGLPMMKRMADHMLVNGINYFVPHAFSPKYPDGDCPPHFYAGGRNPQFPLFGSLMAYMQRMSHVLTDGLHIASAAVLYNAEAEWAGGAYMPFQDVCRTLTRGLIDFDIVHEDLLYGPAAVEDGKLILNGESFGAVVVPQSTYLPYALLAALAGLAEQGVDVVFAGSLCEASCEGRDIRPFDRLFRTVPLDGLSAWMRENGHAELESETPCPDLRFYHIRRDGGDFYMFYNQRMDQPVDTRLRLPNSGPCVVYDAFTNTVSPSGAPDGWLSLYLPGGCSTVVAFGCGIEASDQTPLALRKPDGSKTALHLQAPFSISLREAGQTEWKTYERAGGLKSITADPAHTRFCGAIRYEAAFSMVSPSDGAVLDLGQVGETAQVFLNGRPCGVRIQPPYLFDVSDALRPGENRLTVEVVNSPAYRERDFFSGYLAFPPSGILGPVRILF